MGKLIGGVVFVAGVIAGFGVGIWVAVLGVVDIVDGAKADPTDGWRIAWGFIEIFGLAEIAGLLVFGVFAAVAAVFGFSRSSRKNRDKMLRKSPMGSSAWAAEHDWKRRSGGW